VESQETWGGRMKCELRKNRKKWKGSRSYYKWPEEKAMAPHSSTLAWKIPWMEEPDRL